MTRRRLRLRIWMLMVLVAVSAIVVEAIHLRSLASVYRGRAVSYAQAEQAARLSERHSAEWAGLWAGFVHRTEKSVRSYDRTIQDIGEWWIPGYEVRVRDFERRIEEEKAEDYRNNPWLKRLADSRHRRPRDPVKRSLQALQDFRELRNMSLRELDDDRKTLDAARTAQERMQRRVGYFATLRAKYERAACRPWLPLVPDPPEPPLPK